MGAWVGVIPPSAAQTGLFFKNHKAMNARALQLDGHAQARHAGAQNHHLVLAGPINRARQLRVCEAGQPFDGLICTFKDAALQLKYVPAGLCDLAARCHACGLQRGVQRQRLAMQQLIGAGLNQCGRQSAQIAAQRRNTRLGLRPLAAVKIGARLSPCHAQHGFTRHGLGRRIRHRHIAQR